MLRFLVPVLLPLFLLRCRGGGGTSSPPPAADGSDDKGSKEPAFIVEPYLQLGKDPGPDRMALLWQSADRPGNWAVEVKPRPADAWVRMAAPASVLVDVPRMGVKVFRVWSASLTHLDPGSTFEYRVLRSGKEVFRTEAKGLKAPGQATRVVVAGDLGEPHSAAAAAIARQVQLQNPDLWVAPGDLVYPSGTVREYRQNFYPVYNAGTSAPANGAPFMRSATMVGVLGNHDVDHVGRRMLPPTDSLAYYYFWDQPRGLDPRPDHVPNLSPAANWANFRAAAGDRFPRMGNFCFTSGDVHWTILDTNPYMHWDDPRLQAWLRAELSAARSVTWHFVAFHHPAFNLAAHTHDEGGMRKLWPIFEAGHVDLVFCGHHHVYQRTRPIRFTPAPAGTSVAEHCAEDSNIVVDSAFNGSTVTTAHGPIQIITGAGGAYMHGSVIPHGGPKPYHQEMISAEHSFSIMDINASRVVFQQLDEHGAELDHFTLTH